MSVILPDGYCDGMNALQGLVPSEVTGGFNVSTAVAARSDSAQKLSAMLKSGDFGGIDTDRESLEPYATSYLGPTVVLVAIGALALAVSPYLCCKVCRARTCCGPKPDSSAPFYGRALLGALYGAAGVCALVAAAQGMVNVGSLNAGISLTSCRALDVLGDAAKLFDSVAAPLDALSVSLPQRVDAVAALIDAAPDSPALYAELDAAMLAYKVRHARRSARAPPRPLAPTPHSASSSPRRPRWTTSRM